MKNKEIFEMLNITAWHDAGYTGEGVNIMELEGANPNNPQFDGKLTNDFKKDLGEDDYENSHGSHVFDVIHQVCPDANLFVGSTSASYGGGKVSGTVMDKTIPYIEEKNIHLVGASLGGYNEEELNEELRRLKNNGHAFFTSAGNMGEDGAGEFAQSGEWINVGAVHLRHDKPYRPSYSSIDEVLDFTCFSNLYVQSDKSPDYWFPQQGTSFSNPLLMGMAGLVNDKAIKDIGRGLYQDEIYNMFKDFALDLGKIGHDEYYGHGLVILPNPEDLNITDYVLHDVEKNEEIEIKQNYDNTLKMYPKTASTNGSISYFLNDDMYNMDVVPIIRNGRTLVPIRFVAEAMGCKVDWNEDKQEVIIQWNN